MPAFTHLRGEGMTLSHMLECPFAQLRAWLQEATASGMAYPTAMILATMGEDGRLDQRTILLKHCDSEGLVFFADRDSKKIHDLRKNPWVSLHFPWHELDRQVRIIGRAEMLSAASTTQYFVTRPQHERISIARKGNEVSGTTRHFLIQQFEMMRSKFYDGGDRVPGRWSGYRVLPDQFEFWQGGGPRLRDRIVYKLETDHAWKIISVADSHYSAAVFVDEASGDR